MRSSSTNAAVESVAWDDHVGGLVWRQGEHVALIGPTGQGKTTLALALLRVREEAGGHVVVFGTKPRDRTLDNLRKRGYVKRKDWHHFGARARLRLLWPPYRGPHDAQGQADAFATCIADLFDSGCRTLYLDEFHWCANRLGLERWLIDLLLQGRALDDTIVASMQRPRNVPVEVYSSATHLYFWRTNDDEDLRRIGGLGVLNSRLIRDTVATLPKYHVLYVNTRDDQMMVTKAPKA